MRIGVDVRYLSHGLLGGVHTYVRHFVPALVEMAADHQIYLYADTKCPFELDDLPGHVTVRRLPYRTPLSSLCHDLFMRRQMARDRIDVAHFPANYGFGPSAARTVITVHDAINVLPLREIVRGLKEGYARRTPKVVAMATYLHYCTVLALRRADLVITVSAHAAREISRYGNFDRRKIVPVHHAPTPDLRRIEDSAILADVRQRYHLTCPFVLADGLKNPGVLVEAWQRLPAELRGKTRIVFYSRRPDPLPVVSNAVDRGHACLLVRPPRADLIALYSMAEAFVFPSWIEGFGLPVLEAMACGAPVIASNRGAIPEVAGDAALLSDAEDPVALAQHVELVLTDPAEAQRLRRLGLARASEFSWKKTAEKILRCYTDATLAA